MLTPKFTEKQIKDYLLNQMLRIELAFILRLAKVGEEFVINAREGGQYKDRTGNLRNSIYYTVYKDAQPVRGEVKRSISKDGAQFIGYEKKLLKSFPKGFLLVVRAGMNYAAAVESKGLDVLTGSGQIALQDLNKGLKELRDKIKNQK